MQLSCPACGAEVLFKSRTTVFGVCSYCSSMLVRHDVNLENLGKMAELPPDLTPFQVGTRGRFEATAFELLGRVKVGWENGTWNEWYALFEDGREGWLAEAASSLMMSFAVTDERQIPKRQELFVGRTICLRGQERFEVTDLREATCLGSVGELPFRCPKGRKTVNADLAGAEGQFGCIEYSDEGVRLFLGNYVDIEKLQCLGLRELDGW